MTRTLHTLLVTTLALVPLSSLAQAYPTRPVSIIVPYAAGGSLDVVTRILARSLTTRLGQTVLVENRAGAGSNIGAAYVAKATPDGHTLFLASPATAINVSLYSKLNYDPEKDLIPVSLLTAVPSVLLVHPSAPYKTIADLVSHAKQNPGKLNYSSGGAGSSEHLGSEMFKFYCGVDVTHIPYKGGAPALADLMGGQVTMMFSNRIGALPHIRAGKLRALGVADGVRSPQLPDVPTFAEAGYPDLKVLVWSGIMAPAGTPAAIVNRLHAVITEAMQAPEMKAQMDEMGVTIASGGPAQFGEFLKNQITQWRPIVKASGARVD
ncbi:MAG: Bug family tripartite tricarboxylate transporter substrate binding protein [Betaproteobacteria bacterium]